MKKCLSLSTIILATALLGSCYDAVDTIETDAHLDGSANEELDKFLNQIWLVPRIRTQEDLGVFFVPISTDKGPVAVACFIYPDDREEANSCSKGKISAQRFAGELYVSLDDCEAQYLIYKVDPEIENDRLFFGGVFPNLNKTKIKDLPAVLSIPNKPNYAYSSKLFMSRASLEVSEELKTAIKEIKRVPKGRAAIKAWFRSNFTSILKAEPKLDEVMAEVLKYDKAAAKKYTKKRATFPNLPDHDGELAKRIAIAMGKNTNQKYKTLTTKKFFENMLDQTYYHSGIVKEIRVFSAGKTNYLAVRMDNRTIISSVKLEGDYIFTLTPITHTLRADEYNTAEMDAEEVREFLVKHQTNRAFFGEERSERLKLQGD